MSGFDLCERDVSAPVAVLLHPHPDMGGNRHHPVIDALYRDCRSAPCDSISPRRRRPPPRPRYTEAIRLVGGRNVILLGYSFGADIALTIGDAGVLGWFLVAPPLRSPEHEASAAADPRPKRLVVPEHDEFSPPPGYSS